MKKLVQRISSQDGKQTLEVKYHVLEQPSEDGPFIARIDSVQRKNRRQVKTGLTVRGELEISLRCTSCWNNITLVVDEDQYYECPNETCEAKYDFSFELWKMP